MTTSGQYYPTLARAMYLFHHSTITVPPQYYSSGTAVTIVLPQSHQSDQSHLKCHHNDTAKPQHSGTAKP